MSKQPIDKSKIDKSKREIIAWRKPRTGWFHFKDQYGHDAENYEYVHFDVWWNRINSAGDFAGILTRYDREILYPIFELYAMDRRVLGETAQLWSMIRMLQSGGTEHVQFYKVWLVYLAVLWGHLLGHRFTGHRLEYARNLALIQRRPLMVLIRTAKSRLKYFRDRLNRWREYRRLCAIYTRHNEIRKRGR